MQFIKGGQNEAYPHLAGLPAAAHRARTDACFNLDDAEAERQGEMNSPAINRLRRLFLEQWIEEAIALLDQIDGDADHEDTDEDFVDERENFGKVPGGIGA